MYWIRSRTERGAVAVEFALVVPFLCLILFGMITTGMTYSDHLSLTNAVREGARFGASSPYTQTTPTTISPATWASNVQQRVHDVYFNAGSTLVQNNVCVQLVSYTASTSTYSTLVSAGNNCGTAPSNPSGMADGSCVVKVWTHKDAHIQLLIFPSLDFTIGGTSVSYYGRTTGSCTAS